MNTNDHGFTQEQLAQIAYLLSQMSISSFFTFIKRKEKKAQ